MSAGDGVGHCKLEQLDWSPFAQSRACQVAESGLCVGSVCRCLSTVSCLSTAGKFFWAKQIASGLDTVDTVVHGPQG